MSQASLSLSPPKSSAFVTLVMLGDFYVPGAVALGHSLRRMHPNLNTKFSDISTDECRIDLVVMVTPDVSSDARKHLETVFDHVVEIGYVYQETRMATAKLEKLYNDWIRIAFTKWRCLELIQYEKILFLDCDMIVLQPIDHLFCLNAPAGVFDTDHGCVSSLVASTLV